MPRYDWKTYAQSITFYPGPGGWHKVMLPNGTLALREVEHPDPYALGLEDVIEAKAVQGLELMRTMLTRDLFQGEAARR